MAFEDIAYRLITHCQAEVGQGADNPVIAPRTILLGHADNQGFQLWVDLRSSWSLALGGAVKLLGHQFAVPAENRVRLDDRGHLLQGLLAQLLADLGEGCALSIGEAHAPLQLVAQDAILRHHVLIAHQQFLIDSPCDIRQKLWPIHRLSPQSLPSIVTLSMR